MLSAILWAFDATQPRTKVSSPAEPAVSGSGQRVGVNLLSEHCPVVMAYGEKDACVVELQRLLNRAGAGLEVDGDFGPLTRMRVEVFQIRAGLRNTGLVDEETKRALYAGKARLTTWPRERVVRRIHEVFAEDPDRAVAVANCQSNLDPLHVEVNPSGIRNWGLFQIYGGYTLAELGGTPERALDPEWNIQAAHRLWAKTRDFRAWQCGRAVMPYSPSPG
ncbi:peptidoglycan-binding protein [Carbonactinospora thermoautotrophica]|uniref:peptidoglycan-binding protein n=1 Tax=Carbonactinospora thermoautotrophica TaxID=1469144 RepID=UPI0013012443|nr:peptidoglycan-binding protein [Carbonactinospora thermoautotrophica]